MEESYFDEWRRKHPIRWRWEGFKLWIEYKWLWIIDAEMSNGRSFRTNRVVNEQTAKDWDE